MDILSNSSGSESLVDSGSGAINFGTAIIAAITAIINVLALFLKSKLDPTAAKLLKDQFSEIKEMNKRTSKNMKELNKLLNTRLREVESTITRIDRRLERGDSE
ncbi:hypothetical protein [Brevibacterium sp. ZH18]|uniref:hypothetical protein n=1 Tax=Brevibacterium sp. ZH18 TaxID=2927784 RepID=UPI001F603AA0|nr:hypothetical protein [Brevibacterium sp. ZH18]MCI4012359.1 hypothetical protein [Brevibacterium sp. ZH18]